MSNKSVRLFGALMATVALVPAAGPLYLGIIRDDIHAHSKVGDLGLQAITVAGIALVVAGLVLAIRGARETSGTKD